MSGECISNHTCKDFYIRQREGEYTFFERKIKLHRKDREKSKNTKSITNAFNQKWLKEHNKEEK